MPIIATNGLLIKYAYKRIKHEDDRAEETCQEAHRERKEKERKEKVSKEEE